jgi:hypothetical protein
MTERRFYEQGCETGTKPADHRKHRSIKESSGLLEFLIVLLLAFALVFSSGRSPSTESRARRSCPSGRLRVSSYPR